jgi:hypothetical protein
MPVPIPLILGALQVGGGAAGAIQGNQNRQRIKGEIGKAYKIGAERLRLRQGDQRQSSGESLVARGIATGGNARFRRGPGITEGTTRGIRWTRNTPTPATGPGIRTLGDQATADLTVEQYLEQSAMRAQRDSAYAGADAAATNALVGGIGQAVAGGIQGYQTGQMYNSFRGIDPVNPLSRGAWAAPPMTADQLNVFSDPAWR